jgi:hypothetical protein
MEENKLICKYRWETSEAIDLISHYVFYPLGIYYSLWMNPFSKLNYFNYDGTVKFIGPFFGLFDTFFYQLFILWSLPRFSFPKNLQIYVMWNVKIENPTKNCEYRKNLAIIYKIQSNERNCPFVKIILQMGHHLLLYKKKILSFDMLFTFMFSFVSFR